VSDVLTIVKDLLHETDAFKKDREPNRICVANGDIILRDRREGWEFGFEEADPGTRARARLPVEYLDNEEYKRLFSRDKPFDKHVLERYGIDGPTCPTLLEFLHDLFRDDADVEQKIRFIQQLFGYSLYRRNPFPLVTFFVGEGANGKSELLRVLEALVGPENTAHLTLKDISGRFRLIRLDGKLVNIPHEIGHGTLLDDGLLKTLADGAYMPVEEKGKPVYEAGLFAKHVFATNHAPHCRDVTHGMLRRLRVIEFNRRFTEGEIVPEFAKKITCNPIEMAGVLKWALDGLVDLLNSKGIVEPESSKAVVERWRVEWDSVASFIEAECYLDPAADIPGQDFFDRYHDWAKRNGFRPFSIQQFAKRVTLLTGISPGHKRTGNYYIGIGLNCHRPDPPGINDPIAVLPSPSTAADDLFAMINKIRVESALQDN
jgi:putative DNA primase/helicase